MAGSPNEKNRSKASEGPDKPKGSRASKGDDGVPPEDWRDRHLWQIQPVRDMLVIAGVLAVVWLGYAASIVTVPLLLALLLAYLFEPAVQFLGRVQIGRKFAVASIIVVAAVAVVVPATIATTFGVVQGLDLLNRVSDRTEAVIVSVEDPDNEAKLRELRGPWLSIRNAIVELDERGKAAVEAQEAKQDEGELAEAESEQGDEPTVDTAEDDGSESDPESAGERDDETHEAGGENEADSSGDAAFDRPRALEVPIGKGQRQLASLLASGLVWARDNSQALAKRAASFSAGAIDFAATTAGALVSLIFTGFLTAFFFFFISTGWGRVLDLRDRFIPEEHRERIDRLLSSFDRVVSGFVRGRITIAAIQSVLFTIGYWLIGVPVPMLIGPAVAFLSIVPYLAIVSIPITIALLFIENNGGGFRDAWWWSVGAPLVLYNLGQWLDDYVWTPTIQGKEVGLGTATILFATFAGGAIMGVYGLLLAIPIAACIRIMIDEFLMPRFEAWAKGKRRDFLPFGGATIAEGSPDLGMPGSEEQSDGEDPRDDWATF